jgi:6-phosphofructokinase 1
VVGGDGTHRGALELVRGAAERRLRISIGGIPKTIDNDIPIIDKSFGFDTAVEEAVRPIMCANTEAKAAQNGVGLVKLMGRAAGFIALHASMASRVA